MGWNTLKNLVVKGKAYFRDKLVAKRIYAEVYENLPSIGGGGGGCLCISGSYVGDGEESGQVISNIVPEGYQIINCYVYGHYFVDGEEHAVECGKNIQSGNNHPMLDWDLTHAIGGLMWGEFELTLNNPNRGMTVKGLLNYSGGTYYYTVLAVPIT